MHKNSRKAKINILDIPACVLKIIISYSPKEFLPLCKYLCKITRSLRRQLFIPTALKYSVDSRSIFKTIFSSFNITSLNVSSWNHWNDASVLYLSRLIQSGYFKYLNAIYMSHCYNITNKSLHTILPIMGRRLVTIDLFNCKRINYKPFGSFNPNLKSLYLGFFKRYDIPFDETVDVLEYFFKTDINGKTRILFPKLERLQLFNYIGIESLKPLVNISKTLKCLDIRGCTGIEESEFGTISALTSLEELHIGLIVDSETLLKIFSSCRKITILDISGSRVTSNVIDSICTNLSMISRIKLTSCGYVHIKTLHFRMSNEFLIKLLSTLSNLCLIDVSDSWRLTNSLFDGIDKIASGSRLSKIGIYMCSLDSSTLVYKFNCAGANNVIPVTNQELQIDL